MSRLFLLILAILPMTGLAADTNTFYSSIFGITVTKPASWYFMSRDRFQENIHDLKLKDEELHQFLEKNNVPVAIVTKYLEPYDDLNPSFKVQVLPVADSSTDDPVAIADKVVQASNGSNHSNFKVDVAPVSVTVANRKAAYCKTSYDVVLADGRVFHACGEVWFVPVKKHGYFFMFSVDTRADEKNGSRAEAKEIVSSIKIEE